MISCSAAAALHAVTSDGSSPEPRTIVFALAILAAATLVGIWKFGNALSRKRTEALTTAAIEIGFTFGGEEWPDRGRAPLLSTKLFGEGYDHQIKNIMIGSGAGSRISLFDYSFVVGTGKSQHTYAQTVAAFSKDDVYLPYFAMRPANLLDKAWDTLAHKNIHFDANPEFARRYVLQGALPEKVRDLFTPGLISFAEGLDPHEKWHIEGAGNTLVVYRAEKSRSGPVAKFPRSDVVDCHRLFQLRALFRNHDRKFKVDYRCVRAARFTRIQFPLPLVAAF